MMMMEIYLIIIYIAIYYYYHYTIECVRCIGIYSRSIESRAVRKNRRRKRKNSVGGRREFRILDNFEPPPVSSAARDRRRVRFDGLGRATTATTTKTEGRRPEPYMEGRPRAGPPSRGCGGGDHTGGAPKIVFCAPRRIAMYGRRLSVFLDQARL